MKSSEPVTRERCPKGHLDALNEIDRAILEDLEKLRAEILWISRITHINLAAQERALERLQIKLKGRDS